MPILTRSNHDRAAGLWWFAWVTGIAALIAAGVWIARVEAAPTVIAWVSPWSNMAQVQADWQMVGAPCYSVPQPGKLRLQCQSAGLVMHQTWSRQFPITVTASVSATAAPGSSNDHYFAGLTIYDNASGDTQYGEIALVRGVPPFQGVTVRSAGVLVNDAGYWNGPAAAGWHTLQAVYLPMGQYKLYLDGALVSTVTPWQPLQRDPAVFILCVSVGEAAPNDGSAALCEFGPVQVAGVLSAAVQRTWLPLAHDRAAAGYP